MRLPDFEAWAIFSAVAEQGSFTEAARALGLSKATVSKAVGRLEVHLGASLFNRTSRRLSLTTSGKTLAQHAARILAEAVGAEEAARDEARAPTGLVRLAAPMTFGIAYVGPAVADFLLAYPGISIDLHLSDERVDLVEEGFDAALRIAALPDSSLRARRLADVVVHVVAAPSYLERHGIPTHPAELGEHACFCYANLPNPDTLRFWGPGRQEVAVRIAGPLRANNSDAMMAALLAGLGIAVLPDFVVEEDLAAGRLVRILPDWSPPSVALHLVMPPSTLRPARVEALIDFLTERFGKAGNGTKIMSRLSDNGQLNQN